MRASIPVVLLVAAAAVAGCTTSATPATAPDTTAATTTTSAPTTTTSRPPTTTTTLDRTTEIQTIFEDLERRRLEAIYAGDVEAFTKLFADTPYLERSLEVFDIVEPGIPPTLTIEILEILRDDEECLAIYYSVRTNQVPESSEPATVVLLPVDSAYKYLFTNDGRGGWLCDGTHPLSQS